jgi:hypothetical protein
VLARLLANVHKDKDFSQVEAALTASQQQQQQQKRQR